MKRYLYLIMAITLLISCKNKLDNNAIPKGFTDLGNGVFYKTIETTKADYQPQSGDLVAFDMTIKKNEEVVSQTTEPLEQIIDEESEVLPVQRILKLMTKGERVKAMIYTDSLTTIPPNFAPNQLITLELKIVNISTKSERTASKETVLEEFKPTNEGFAVKETEVKPPSRKPKAGEEVIINMTMRNGDVVIAKSGDMGTPRQFIIPTDDKMQTPLHRAIKNMNLGDSITIAIDVNDFPRIPRGFSEGDIMQVDIRLVKILND